MSGSSLVESSSTWFHLSSESPCMNFVMNPDHPDQEQNWHRRWTERATAWLARLHAVVEARLGAGGDDLIAYDERLPLWSTYRADVKAPCRIEFLAMGGGGSVLLVAAFSSIPDETERERFRAELMKDIQLIEGEKS